MLHFAVTHSCRAEVLPFHVWEECLSKADTRLVETQPITNLLTWLIKESVSDDPVRLLVTLCDGVQLINQLPVVAALLSRLPNEDTGG